MLLQKWILSECFALVPGDATSGQGGEGFNVILEEHGMCGTGVGEVDRGTQEFIFVFDCGDDKNGVPNIVDEPALAG